MNDRVRDAQNRTATLADAPRGFPSGILFGRSQWTCLAFLLTLFVSNGANAEEERPSAKDEDRTPSVETLVIGTPAPPSPAECIAWLEENRPGNNAPPSERSSWLQALAGCEIDRTRFHVAERHLRSALRLTPHDPILLANLSVAIGKQHRYPEAEAIARRALELDGADPMHLNLVLASWEYANGKHEAALRRAALVPEPKEPFRKALYFGCLACLHGTTGDEDACRKAMVEGLRHDEQGSLRHFFETDPVFNAYREKTWFRNALSSNGTVITFDPSPEPRPQEAVPALPPDALTDVSAPTLTQIVLPLNPLLSTTLAATDVEVLIRLRASSSQDEPDLRHAIAFLERRIDVLLTGTVNEQALDSLEPDQRQMATDLLRTIVEYRAWSPHSPDEAVQARLKTIFDLLNADDHSPQPPEDTPHAP